MAHGKSTMAGKTPLFTSKHDRPMVIAAFLGHQALGEFVMQHLTAASIAGALPGSKLGVIYRDDRSYKNFITLMNPYVSATIRIPAGNNAVIPLDWFDGDDDAPNRPFDAAWRDQGFHNPDIFLTPSMLDIGRCLAPTPVLRIPPHMTDILSQSLVQRGVDRDRWFACVHMREPHYFWRYDVDPFRNVDPKSYLPMISNIINKQGGQVVRLGDPSMTPFPEMDGLIDLSRSDNNFPEQAFALSRARFFVGAESGTTQLASAMKAPAVTSNVHSAIGVWNDGDVAMVKKSVLPDGNIIAPRDMLKSGALTIHTLRPVGIKKIDNTPDELIAVADHMYKITSDCVAWRKEITEEPNTHASSSGISLPLQWRHIHEYADLTLWE